ncbi:MAG: phosphate ABC transporter permease subunit PstC [Thermoplasmata archaeon]|nr:phosphate ABC transporter permease subunit PstC [Thermoplasmata archaeon]
MARGTSSGGYRAAIRSLLKPLIVRYPSVFSESAIYVLLFSAAAVSIFVTLAIAFIFLSNSVVFFSFVNPLDFFLGLVWSPEIQGLYGVVPLVWGTLFIAAGAAGIGLPVGLGVAVYLHEYAPGRVRDLLKPTLEILAAVPTIVYALFALLVIAPALQALFNADFFNGANAMIVIGVMIIPMVASLSEDALSAVPRRLRDGSLALGATRLETMGRVMIPAALSGVLASFLLALSRAVGETMVVLLVTGNRPEITLNLFESMATLTTEIAARALGDLPVGSVEYLSIFALGTTLFIFTLTANLISVRLRRRFREVYD